MQALYYAELFNRARSLGRAGFSLRKPHPRQSDLITSGINTMGQPVAAAAPAAAGGSEHLKPAHPGANRRMNREGWLDVDVIDTTFVEQNVHAIRHVRKKGIIHDAHHHHLRFSTH